MSLASIRPLHKQVLIIPDQMKKVTVGGIIVPNNARQESKGWGTVVATGPGAGVIESGDRIFFKIGHGTVVMIDGKQHWLVSSDADVGICLMIEKPS